MEKTRREHKLEAEEKKARKEAREYARYQDETVKMAAHYENYLRLWWHLGEPTFEEYMEMDAIENKRVASLLQRKADELEEWSSRPNVG